LRKKKSREGKVRGGGHRKGGGGADIPTEVLGGKSKNSEWGG